MLLSTLKFCKDQLELETGIKNQCVTRPELYPLQHEIQSKIKLIDILNATNKKYYVITFLIPILDFMYKMNIHSNVNLLFYFKQLKDFHFE